MADSEHKKIYNKNAREKALLEEAYASVYVEQDQPDWWQKIKVIEISDVDAEGSAGDAWISKAEIDGTELTDDQYETVNNDRDFIEAIARPLIDGDPDIAGGRSYTGPPAIEWAEDGEFNLRDVNPEDTLFGDRKREEREEDQEIGEDAAGSPNVIHDVLEKVYEISGRLHGEIEDLGIFLPREHSKRWTKLEELQKELESVVGEYGDDKFWAARQEDRKYSAEPTGYHEW